MPNLAKGGIRIMGKIESSFGFKFLALLAGVLVLLSTFAGCQSRSPELLIQGKVATRLTAMAADAINAWDKEIAAIDAELTKAEIKLGKVNQVAAPALKWVDLMKAKGQQEQWNSRILEVTSDLNKLKNDQFKVAKLQLNVELLSAGLRYTPVIQIDELATGQITEYEELRNTLQRQVTTLTQQREAIAKARNTARSTAMNVFAQYKNWKVQRVNSITYAVSGQGLGMETALTTGRWEYSTDADQLTALDNAAIALRKVLTGK